MQNASYSKQSMKLNQEMPIFEAFSACFEQGPDDEEEVEAAASVWGLRQRKKFLEPKSTSFSFGSRPDGNRRHHQMIDGGGQEELGVR